MAYIIATSKKGETLTIPEASIKYIIEDKGTIRIQLNDNTVLYPIESLTELDNNKKAGLTK